MKKKCWMNVGLTKKQLCFLDEISKNCRFSGGRKLCRTSIIRAFLKAGKRMDIDVSGVKSEEEIKERFLVSFRQAH